MSTNASARRLSERALELIAARFKVLSETIRLRLLMALEAGEKTVTELVEATQATQANVSRQLQTLADAGLVARRKEGVSVYYRIADPAVFALCEQVCGSLRQHLAQQAETSKLFGGRT